MPQDLFSEEGVPSDALETPVKKFTRRRMMPKSNTNQGELLINAPKEVQEPPAESVAPQATIRPDNASEAAHTNGENSNQPQNWNNRNKHGNKNQPNKVVKLPPTYLQKYRWWIGQLLQWQLIHNANALEALANECADPSLQPFVLNDWYDKSLSELLKEAPEQLRSAYVTRKAILYEKMRSSINEKHAIWVTGVATKLPNTDEWALCYASDNYQLRDLSAYIPKALVRSYGLRCGQTLQVQLFVSPTYEQCPCVIHIQTVMGKKPEEMRNIPYFKELTACYPNQRILLESEPEEHWDNQSMRSVDILTPIGFGQRGIIVAPPRTGKTVLLQNIAHSIVKNQPQAYLIVLLIDERPEEVTDFKHLLPGVEVISSTFDEPPESHVRSAEIVIEKAKRLVEMGSDVIILLDSITRLARAYNTLIPSSGKVLSGGVEANALQGPKAFFGAARNIEQGGSLTILGTALIDTGSKMDEVIFEEFKGTGNMEIYLDRSLIEKRIFPAINIEKSGTRKEELLYHPDELKKIYMLRRAFKSSASSTGAMELLLERIRDTRNNVEFLLSINA